MPLFTLYDTDTGEITGLLEGTEQTAALNGSYIEGHFEPDEYRVVNGVATAKADAEVQAKREADALIEMKIKRNNALMASDWTQVSDNALTASQRQAWATYRQQLRDLPSNINDPLNIVWPTEPDL